MLSTAKTFYGRGASCCALLIDIGCVVGLKPLALLRRAEQAVIDSHVSRAWLLQRNQPKTFEMLQCDKLGNKRGETPVNCRAGEANGRKLRRSKCESM